MAMMGRLIVTPDPHRSRRSAGSTRPPSAWASVVTAMIVVVLFGLGTGHAQVATEAPAVAQSAEGASMPAAPTKPPGAAPAIDADQLAAAALPPRATEERSPPRSTDGHAHDLSPLGMFLAADLVVKAVMVGLAAASLLVWTIWTAKRIQLWMYRRRLSKELTAIIAMPCIEPALAAVRHPRSLARSMLDVVAIEKRGLGGFLSSGAVERIHSRLGEIEARISRDVRGGMSFLATVGATAPFIGLFGTVWGIMNSFIGISKAQTTSLAVVAPGIAEALLATAIGLVAAIPAVILYNNLGKGIATFRRLVRETRGEVERIASREMEGHSGQQRFPNLAFAAE